MSEIQVGVRLTVVLSTRPHIANYMRSLEVSISSPWRISFPQALPTVLSSLPCLNKISLSSARHIKWRSLPETFRTAFIGTFHLPSINLKSISIMRMDSFPLSALNGCKGVKDLTLTSRVRPGQCLTIHHRELVMFCNVSKQGIPLTSYTRAPKTTFHAVPAENLAERRAQWSSRSMGKNQSHGVNIIRSPEKGAMDSIRVT